MQVRFGKQEFSFFPRTFILPQDIKLLRKAWEDSGSRQKWIIKPVCLTRYFFQFTCKCTEGKSVSIHGGQNEEKLDKLRRCVFDSVATS